MLRWEASDLKKKDSAGVTDDSRGDFSGGLKQGYELGSLTDGLVAYFPFDGGVEDKALSHNVTDNTSAGFVSGKVGSEAKDFDGSDDYVDIPSKVIDAAPPVTFSFWFNLDSELNGEWETFLSNYDGSSGIICGDDDNEGKFRFWVDGTEIFGPTVETNKWFHYVGQVLEDGTIRLYFDGKLEDKGSTGTSINTGEDLRLGMRPNEEFPTSVKIDDLRIYDRALSRPEIEALYRRSSTQEISDQDRLTSGLVGHWPLNEDRAGKAYDLSGNDFDSTSVTGTSTAVGLGGAKARNFDGSDDNITLEAFEWPNKWSMSVWFKTSTSVDEILYRKADENYVYFRVNDSKFSNPNFTVRNMGASGGYGSNGDKLYTNEDLLDDRWHNAVMTDDGSNTVLYIDGREIDSMSSSSHSGSTKEFLGSNKGSGYYFNGSLMDARFYERPLTKSEIETLARNGGLDV